MKSILIADDDPMMVKLIEFNLRRAGYQVLVCREGLSVCDKVRASRPALVILDVMIRGRTGLELLRACTTANGLTALPVLIVTSEGQSSTEADLLAAGALNVFTKPFSPTMLLDRIRQLLGDSQTQSEN